MKFFKKIKIKIFWYVKEIMDKKRKNIFIEPFLFLLSVLYRSIVFLRNLAYDLQILKSHKVRSKVISIGNIECGGAGKTPFTIFLADKVRNKVAIISRGYRSKYENKSLYVAKSDNFSALDIGDEPFLLKNRIKNASIFVGKNKLESAKKASALNYDLIFIDDGFQYRKLKKDLEIVVLNAKSSFVPNKFLPFGNLRENLKSLKRADYIVINNADDKDEKLEKEIKKYSNCPIIYTKPCPGKFLGFSKNVKRIEKDTKVAVFCGIANPNLFFNAVKKMGLNIVNSLYLLDHEEISLEQLNKFVKKSLEKKARFVITTEKDFVKLSLDVQKKFPILYLEIILKIIANHHHQKTLVENICKLVNN